MAYTLVIGNNDYFSVASPPVTDKPFTFVAKVKPVNITTNYSLVILYNSGGGNIYQIQLAGGVGGDPFRAYNYDGSSNIADTTAGFIAGIWNYICAVFTATDIHVYIAGGNKGSAGGTRSPTGIDGCHLGAGGITGGIPEYSGDMAEVAFYNIAFTDDDAASHAEGYSPLLLRPQNLVSYWKLIRGLNDEVGGNSLTANGSPTVSVHPRMIYPARTHIGVPTVSVPSVKPMWYYQRNKMRRAC